MIPLRPRDATPPRRMFLMKFGPYWGAVIATMLREPGESVHIRYTRRSLERARLGPGDRLILWGRNSVDGLPELVAKTGVEVLRLEDGFFRSAGFGRDGVPPHSLSIDRRGVHYDGGSPSDLEFILQNMHFDRALLRRAARLRAFIVSRDLTKYNVERREAVHWPSRGRKVVLVTGQVEDDASIRYSFSKVRSNLELLAAARKAHPHEFLVYKPHPDVTFNGRRGRVAWEEAQGYADLIETEHSVVSCIAAADVVHTMTSQAGFDALLRGKTVVTHGQPFYAGWGLTDDKETGGTAFVRRTRRLTLDELVAGALILYPYHWNWRTLRRCDCETSLRQLAGLRNRSEKQPLMRYFLMRKARKYLRIVTTVSTFWPKMSLERWCCTAGRPKLVRSFPWCS